MTAVGKSYRGGVGRGDWEPPESGSEAILRRVEGIVERLRDGLCPGCGQPLDACQSHHTLEEIILGRLRCAGVQAEDLPFHCPEHGVDMEHHAHGEPVCPEYREEMADDAQAFIEDIKEEQDA